MHIPRKRFGQNFLHDNQVITRLVDMIAPQSNQHLVEIGPGQGALTFPVLKRAGSMDVIELDRDLVPLLIEKGKAFHNFHIHQHDALKFDFASLAKDQQRLRIIGNLPYNISTPLIFHLLSFASEIIDMHFMLQKEVVDRLAASVNTSAYGRLSIMVQYHCEVSALFEVPPHAFTPAPKVVSRIVRITPRQSISIPANNYATFAQLVALAFNQRRKTLRNSLKPLVTTELWEQSQLDANRRPEELAVNDFVLLSNLVHKKG